VHKPLNDEIMFGALTRAGVSAARADVVLVVDDDPLAQRLLQATLSSSGYQVVGRVSAEAGLAVARELVPQAIVLDLLMPGVDGFEFLRRLRAMPALQRVPVLVWTGKDLSPDDRAELTHDAQAVVAKGHGARALLDELRGLLSVPVTPADLESP